MEPRLAAEGPALDPGLVGRTFGQYHIISLIQRGGMGEIYLAELAPQGIRVVLKRLQDVHTSDERYVEMFQNEAAMMSDLDHPNIVKVLGTPIIEGKQCLVLEFVRGRNLQQVLRALRQNGRHLPPPIALHVMRKTLLGLHEAHQARFPDGRSLDLVHRDVKPANILVSFAGDVKITDFGIAKSSLQNRMTTAGVVKGTVRYLSPEQIRSEKVSFRSDLFSCASVLTEILTDQPLYDRGPVAPTLMAILNDDRAPIRDLLPFRAPELAEVLERALSSRPQARFGSALEMAHALGAAARALGPPASDDDVGSLLRHLFQGALDRPSAATPEDVTYLLHNDSGVRRSGAAAPRAPAATPRGGTPLDADGFLREPPPLPAEYLQAEERASSMLEESVVIDAPVEIEVEGSDSLDLDLADFDVDDALEASEVDPPDSVEALEVMDAANLEGPTDGMDAAVEMLRFEVPSGTAAQPESTPLASIGPRGPVTRSGEYALVDAERLRAQIRAEQASALSSSVGLPAVDRAELDAAEVEPDDRPRLRFYLLVGCLGGVLLTCAVVALTSL